MTPWKPLVPANGSNSATPSKDVFEFQVPAQLEIKCVFVIIQTHIGGHNVFYEVANFFPALVQREPALLTRVLPAGDDSKEQVLKKRKMAGVIIPGMGLYLASFKAQQ